MNLEGNEKYLTKSNNYVNERQISNNVWNVIKAPAIFFAKVGAAVLLDRKRLVLSDFLLDNNTMAYPINTNFWNVDFCYYSFQRTQLSDLIQVGALPSYNANQVDNINIRIPKNDEQVKIGAFLGEVDTLITLHHRMCFYNVKTKKCYAKI